MKIRPVASAVAFTLVLSAAAPARAQEVALSGIITDATMRCCRE